MAFYFKQQLQIHQMSTLAFSPCLVVFAHISTWIMHILAHLFLKELFFLKYLSE